MTIRSRIFLVLCCVSLFQAKMAFADEVTVTLDPQSRLWLDGDSTLHRFTVNAKTVHATFAVAAGATSHDVAELVRHKQLQSLSLQVPVVDLRSGESGLDDNLRKALHAESHPDIFFRMEHYEVVEPAPSDPAADFKVVISGVLTIASHTKTVQMEIVAKRVSNGWRFVGGVDVSMKAFAIEAPTFALGLMKTKDKIRVNVDLILQAQASRG